MRNLFVVLLVACAVAENAQAAEPSSKPTDGQSKWHVRFEREPWHNAIDKVYQLPADQVLRRVSPDQFPPERSEYARWESFGSMGASTWMTFYCDPKLERWSIRSSPLGLASVLEECVGIHFYICDIPHELRALKLPGDWVSRKSATQEQRVEALEGILQREFGRKVHFEKTQEMRDVIVAQGDLKVLNPKRPQVAEIELYSDHMSDVMTGLGSGSGDLDYLLLRVAGTLRRPIINEAKPTSLQIAWREHESGLSTYITDHDVEDQFLMNLEKQTSLKFEKQRREVQIWVAKEE